MRKSAQDGTSDLARTPAFTIADVTITPALGTAQAPDGRTARIQPQTMRMLIALVAAEGRTLSRAELRAMCWGDRSIGHDAIDRVIARVRQINVQVGPFLTLRTIPKVGYQFVAEHAAAGPPPAPPPPTPSLPSAAPSAHVDRRTLLIAGAGAAGLASVGAFAAVRLRRDAPRAITLAVVPLDTPPGDAAARTCAQEVLRDCRTVLARTDGVAIEEGDAAAMRVGGSAATLGGRVRVGLDLTTRDRQQMLATTTRMVSPGATAAASSSIAGALAEKVAGLVGPAQVVRRNPAYQRDPAAVGKVHAAERLIDESRNRQMLGEDAACADAADAALSLVRQARRVDAADPGALVALAALERTGWSRELVATPRTALQRVGAGRELLRTALLSDPNDAGVLAAVADGYRRYEWRWDEAENLLRRALAYDPNLVSGHWTYCYMLGTQGRARDALPHALALRRLAPDYLWQRVALPRILYLIGQRERAMALYDVELRRAPGNAFLLRELYFIGLSEGNGAALEQLAQRCETMWQGRVMPAPVARLIARARVGAQAIAGAPAGLLALVAADAAAYDAAAFGPKATTQGRASIDLMFVYAMEYAWARHADAAITMLGRALAARSLYWPASLPYGPAEFPPIVRDDPRYAALWQSDPRLVTLVARRREALSAGQMSDARPDGTRTERTPI